MRRTLGLFAASAMMVAACTADDPVRTPAETPPAPTTSEASEPVSDAPSSPEASPETTATSEEPTSPSPDPATQGPPVEDFEATEHGSFNRGWSMTFLPGSNHLLVAERGGAWKLRDQDTGEVVEIQGTPDVVSAGQGGMHDVLPGPNFEEDHQIYFSWVRAADGGSQGVVARGTLDPATAQLGGVEELWVQDPASGNGHFSLRLLIHEDHLFITSGEREEMSPAQDMGTNQGKIIRLGLDGSIPADNPFADQGDEAGQFWSIGHRNALGIEVDGAGNIWASEMGPEGGDELNLIVPGANYGWPEASMGVHYDGTPIPDHTEGDGYEAPKEFFVPAISPGNLAIYQGDMFTGWNDSALLGGLSGQNLVRVELRGDSASEVDRWDMGERIRAVEVAPDGSIWVLQDGEGGQLLQLVPAE